MYIFKIKMNIIVVPIKKVFFFHKIYVVYAILYRDHSKTF